MSPEYVTNITTVARTVLIIYTKKFLVKNLEKVNLRNYKEDLKIMRLDTWKDLIRMPEIVGKVKIQK